jgi:hypothetical protein
MKCPNQTALLQTLVVVLLSMANAAWANPVTQTDGICSLRAPDNYVHFIGKSYQKRDALAGQEARVDAEKQVEAKVCAALADDALCQRAKSSARRFREGRDADDSMCSVYQMRADALDPQSKAASDFTDSVQNGIKSLGLSSSTPYILQRARNGANGCGVGRLGRALSNELRKKLTVGTTAGSQVVSPLIETNKDRVFFHIEKSDGKDARYSDTVDLTNYAQFMGWEPSETQCGTASATPSWFADSMKQGKDLLKIQGADTLCSGDIVSLSAFPPSQANTVELVSIDPEGKAFFIASRSTNGGSKVSLGEFAVYSGPNAITATVVAAFRPNNSRKPQTSPCILSDNQVERFDRSATALGSLAYDVAANGEQRCTVTEEAVDRAAAIEKMIASMPQCVFGP